MAQYYYLVASFPMLFFDSERPPADDSFMEECRQQLSDHDFAVLAASSIAMLDASQPSCGVLDRWRSWETALRNEVVKLRAKSGGIDPARYLREGPAIVSAAHIARDAFAQGAPLSAEQTLDRARWQYLDELEEGHYFDLQKVVVYYLRLQILHRQRLFDADKGKAAFEEIFRGITRPIREGVQPSVGGES